MRLSFRKVSYEVNGPDGQPQQVLREVSGVAEPGELLAIMGPSGAGKTTLLDVLAGRIPASDVTGQVLYDNAAFSAPLKRQLAYCTQEDVLLGALTCRENIWYSARLRLPSSCPAAEVDAETERALTALGLARVADSFVGTPFHRGISGGEKRRVSVAAELVARPAVLFLDEPTSGLDAAAAFQLLQDLARTAAPEAGAGPRKVVVAVIHQPSTKAFEVFHRLQLLVGGRSAFHGGLHAAKRHFEANGFELPQLMNPAEHYIESIALDFLERTTPEYARRQHFVDLFDHSPAGRVVQQEIEKQAAELAAGRGGSGGEAGEYDSWWRASALQLRFVTSRALLNSLRDVTMFWVRLAMYSAMAVLMGVTWWQTGDDAASEEDRISAYFFSNAFLCFMSVAAVPAVLEQRRVLVRDQDSAVYPPEVFVAAQLSVSAPALALIAACFSAIALPMMALGDAAHDVKFAVVLFTALMAAEGMVLAVALLLPSFIAALTVASFMNGFFMIVQGYFVRRPRIPVGLQWAHYLSYQKYAFEAMMVQGFEALDLYCAGYDSAVDGSQCSQCGGYIPHAVDDPAGAGFCQFSGRQVLQRLDYEDEAWARSLGCLALVAAVFWALFYLGAKTALSSSNWIVDSLPKFGRRPPGGREPACPEGSGAGKGGPAGAGADRPAASPRLLGCASLKEDRSEAVVADALASRVHLQQVTAMEGQDASTPLEEVIREAVLGQQALFVGPFGVRKITYADYTASGRALSFVEGFMSRCVLPMYANTHTEASATGLYTGYLREEARAMVMAAMGADVREYACVFVGSGCTGAIAKLVDVLGLRLQAAADHRFGLRAKLAAGGRPLVFVGPYEHHSNELVWRESLCDVVVVPEDARGHIDQAFLEAKLQEEQRLARPVVIGSFSAGSNVTGLRSDDEAITALLHRYGALSFWDYAGAGPYTAINCKTGSCSKDAIFVSPHKFIGGPGSSGVLVLRRNLVACSTPTMPGGGTVRYVDMNSQDYDASIEAREEAGTPNILADIRAGIAFHVKSLVGSAKMEALEHRHVFKVLERWKKCPNLWLVGSDREGYFDDARLGIVSFNVAPPPGVGKDALMLHPHFLCALLNDLYGIQSRSGCSCTGPYGERLFLRKAATVGPWFSIDATKEMVIDRGVNSMKLGWCRVNFNYFISDEEAEFIASAVEQVAEHGWKLLPLYIMDARSGVWTFRGHNAFNSLPSLHSMNFVGGKLVFDVPSTCARDVATWDYNQVLEQALELYLDPGSIFIKNFGDLYFTPSVLDYGETSDYIAPFLEDVEKVRWFPLPSEVCKHLGVPVRWLEGDTPHEETEPVEQDPVSPTSPPTQLHHVIMLKTLQETLPESAHGAAGSVSWRGPPAAEVLSMTRSRSSTSTPSLTLSPEQIDRQASIKSLMLGRMMSGRGSS